MEVWILCVLQGPVMSAHKKLLGEKLAEEEAERKVKRESKKEKRMVKFVIYSTCHGFATFLV